MKLTQRLRSLFAVTVAAGLCACGGGGNDNIATSSTTNQSVRYSLSAPAVSKQGTFVPITFSGTNVGSAAASFHIPPMISIYKDNSQIWDPTADGSVVYGRNAGVTLDPGGAYTFNVVWNQKDYGGNLVAPGTYTVKSSLPEDTEQITITIQ